MVKHFLIIEAWKVICLFYKFGGEMDNIKEKENDILFLLI